MLAFCVIGSICLHHLSQMGDSSVMWTGVMKKEKVILIRIVGEEERQNMVIIVGQSEGT